MPHKFAGRLVSEILLLKKGSIRTALLPKGLPVWLELEQWTWEQIEAAAARNEPGLKTVRKLLSDQRFDR